MSIELEIRTTEKHGFDCPSTHDAHAHIVLASPEGPLNFVCLPALRFNDGAEIEEAIVLAADGTRYRIYRLGNSRSFAASPLAAD